MFKVRYEWDNGKIEVSSYSNLDAFLSANGYEYEFISVIEELMDKVEDGTADNVEISRLDFFIDAYEDADDNNMLGGNNIIVLDKGEDDYFVATVRGIGSGSSESETELVKLVLEDMVYQGKIDSYDLEIK